MISQETSNLAVVFTDYGTGNGIQSYNGTAWTSLTSWVPSIDVD
jgi:hypothetical protein